MGGIVAEAQRDQINAGHCLDLHRRTIEEALAAGVREFVICTGKRDAPLILQLKHATQARCYYWPEERSAAFFALGKIRASGLPVAVITTSGSAVGELLPAAMEAYYSGDPLLLITADRPRRMRGTGAPQSVEQVGIFSHYVHFSQDLEEGEMPDLSAWGRHGPAHMNVCLEEPERYIPRQVEMQTQYALHGPLPARATELERFLSACRRPLAIVSSLPPSAQGAVASFLRRTGLPAYVEGHSGIREKGQRVFDVDLDFTDGILRIGGIPTVRAWRDLEDHPSFPVFCLSEQPFSGLSRQHCLATDIAATVEAVQGDYYWEADTVDRVSSRTRQYPLAEPSMFRSLSEVIPEGSRVFLGNSMPIREWDLCATYNDRQLQVFSSRGVNGIDGQLSTFFGLCSPDCENWALVGDLTALYDLVAPWILGQIGHGGITVVIINNGGGMIFSREFDANEMLCKHRYTFEHWAAMWEIAYERWHSIPNALPPFSGVRVIEVVPDPVQTDLFWGRR